MRQSARAKVFWSGGSQAVRLPKALRLDSSEVIVRRSGSRLILEPQKNEEGWGDFWDRLLPLRALVTRHPTPAAEKRKPL
jgi:antitoxin VapB